MNEFLKRAQALTESMLKDRRWLHQHAEVGDDLPETSGYVMTRLREIGLEPREICPGGIVAHIYGKKPGKTYLLRADMDALPMREDNDLPFRSRTDNAHNCGHDIHTAMLLAAAQMLREREEELQGCVKLMFQPNEEQFKGSLAMIRAGVLENPHVDACSAMHVMLDEEAPAVGWCGGYISSSCDGFKITVQGEGCHGAMPHLGVDPINAGLHIYQAFQSLIARESPPSETAILTLGQFSAGTASNIIPQSAVLQGTLRTYNKELRARLSARMRTVAEAAGAMFGAKVEYQVLSDVPSCYADPGLLEELVGYLEDMGGGKVYQAKPFTPSDDMAFLTERVPSVYLQLGAKVPGNPYPHHNACVLFDEKAMPYGAAIHAQCAFEWLKHHPA